MLRPILLFCVLWFCLLANVMSQQLVEVITKTEKALLVAKSYSIGGYEVDEGSGFFLSSDGIALLPASLFYKGDSVVVELRSGRKYTVLRILQCHPYANVALVRIANPKQHEFSYLLPSRETFFENQDVLVCGHPLELDGGFDALRLGRIKHQFFLKRQSVLRDGMSARSFCSPVVNTKGQCVGVVNAYDSTRLALMQNILFLNDTLWYPVNKQPKQLRQNQSLRDRMSSSLNEGFYYFSINEYSESARLFSRYLKLFARDADIYCIRGHVRFMYKNNFGSREDFNWVATNYPTNYLLYYFEGIQLMREKRYTEALANFSKSLECKPDFAYSLVEHGRAMVHLRGDKQAAFENFEAAIRVDSTYGAAYYEKARLVLQYAENNEFSFEDINHAIVLDPDLPGIYTIRGTLYIAHSDYMSATHDFDKAIIKDPNDKYALFNRGVALYNMGMSDRACEDWQLAVHLGYSKAVDYVTTYCNSKARKQGR